MLRAQNAHRSLFLQKPTHCLRASTGSRGALRLRGIYMLAFEAFRRAFDFKGRSSRAEFWQFLIVQVGALIVAAVLDSAFDNFTPVFTYVVAAAIAIPSSSVAVRRLHDINRSGFLVLWLWLSNFMTSFFGGFSSQVGANLLGQLAHILAVCGLLVQLALAIYALLQFAAPGDTEANRYGLPVAVPAGADPSTEIAELGARAASFVSKLGQGDPLSQIERLSKLREAGALTEEEFAEQKAALLKRL
jgi:uncharacterized membrane protein YhaH (DUF805 family)